MDTPVRCCTDVMFLLFAFPFAYSVCSALNSSFIKIPNSLLSLNILIFFYFELKIILKLLLSSKDVTWSEIQRIY